MFFCKVNLIKLKIIDKYVINNNGFDSNSVCTINYKPKEQYLFNSGDISTITGRLTADVTYYVLSSITINGNKNFNISEYNGKYKA